MSRLEIIETGTAILIGAMAMFVIWRSRKSWPPLPPWTWRNIIALICVAATIAFAIRLTQMAWNVIDLLSNDADRLITELVRDPKVRPEVGQVLVIIYEAIAWGLKLLLAGVLMIVLSLGLPITARRFRGDKSGFEFSGGEDEPAATAAAADKTSDFKAEQP